MAKADGVGFDPFPFLGYPNLGTKLLAGKKVVVRATPTSQLDGDLDFDL